MKRGTCNNINGYAPKLKNKKILIKKITSNETFYETCNTPIKELTKIYIHLYNLHNPRFQGISKINITDFSPLYNLITNPNVIFKSLTFSNCELTDNSLIYISEIIKKNTLIKLDLSYNKIENINIIIDALKNNTSLLSIDLSHNNIKNIDLLCEALKDKLVKFLYLNNNKIENNEKIAELIKENKTIRILHINDNHFTNINNIGDALKYNSSIKHLNIFDCLTDLSSVTYFLNSLQFNHTIININICSINTSNFNILEPLQYNSSLKTLCFTGIFNNCKQPKYINSEVLAKIISNKKLKELDMYTCKINSSLYPLVKVLIEKDNIEYLDLNNTNIDITELVNYLSKTNNLKELDISHNYISNIILFTDAIKSNKSITKLTMNYIAENANDIIRNVNIFNDKTPEDVKRLDISYFLQNAVLNNKNCNLYTLEISGLINNNNSINILSEIIKTNHTITRLYFCGNIWYSNNENFEKIDLWPLIDALKSNNKLEIVRVMTQNIENNSKQFILLNKTINLITRININKKYNY